MDNASMFSNIDTCLLTSQKPSERLQNMLLEGHFDREPFSLLKLQTKTAQSPLYHPEGSVWNHTLLVVDEAARMKKLSSEPRSFMWAALLHDIGKPVTTRTRKGKITAYDHDKIGAVLARGFLSRLTADNDFIMRVFWLVSFHMQILYVVKNMPFQDLGGMRRHTAITEVALLGYCDRLGRAGADRHAERMNLKEFLKKCGEKEEPIWLRQA